ncbi:lysozyme inhibitor LprI family protein [Allochromatium palmeri]|uniref:DUF1311 domain-containing protein n=1 Tax=Allochromatium palmeri TaxID=231048 RepID=A0A6N8EEF5_9GAMM|nr:lysozyme inhibitor LprI family protein [Allochromatium palmeri]MTW22615.1 DUF1311 domain-containing protein [Allochromatium palmeri]
MQKTFILAVLCAISVSAQARECDESTMNAVEFRTCVSEQNEGAIRYAYNRLIQALEPNQTAIDAIREAQSHWEKFRDATCYYVSETATREDGAYCVDEFNQARVKMLNRYTKKALSQ